MILLRESTDRPGLSLHAYTTEAPFSSLYLKDG